MNHAGPAAYLGQATLEMLTPQYDVVVFKHCFPVCNIEADTGDPDVTSSVKTTENYKAQYEALKTKLRSFPANRFVLWTGAAKLQSEISVDMATRARAFFDWVMNEWDEPGDNIYVWDFYDLETGGGIYMLPENASSDSHPNATFGAAVAPLFCQRVVDVIQGSGDPPDDRGRAGLRRAHAGAGRGQPHRRPGDAAAQPARAGARAARHLRHRRPPGGAGHGRGLPRRAAAAHLGQPLPGRRLPACTSRGCRPAGARSRGGSSSWTERSPPERGSRAIPRAPFRVRRPPPAPSSAAAGLPITPASRRDGARASRRRRPRAHRRTA